MKLPFTVRLVHFTGEEQGLWGSYAYSDQVAAAKTDILAMVQVDMIGYCAKPGNRVDIHDIHATVLHQLGVDHERLTYRHGGRDFRLTDVFGKVVTDILA